MSTYEDEIIYNFRQRYLQVSQEMIARYMAAITDEQRQQVLAVPKDTKMYQTCLWHYYQRSLTELQRLGYQEHENAQTWTNHHPLAVIEYHFPEQDESLIEYGQRLDRLIEEKYAIPKETIRPTQTMWDILATRVEGDACIACIGDDRDNMRLIGVCWYPQGIRDDYYWPTGLL